MEFRRDELLVREIEIAALLIQHMSLKQIGETTGLSKKLLTAHIKNMMKKMKAKDIESLIQLLQTKLNQ